MQAAFLTAFAEANTDDLRPTTTRVTMTSGHVRVEKRAGEGHFETHAEYNPGRGQFMVEDTSADHDLHEVVPCLFIGSQGAAHNRGGIDECGVTHIINCATGIHNAFEDELEYLSLGLYDVPEQDVREVVRSSAKWIGEVIDAGGKVLVHCNAGVSRSAVIVIAYLMIKQGMSLEDALAKAKAARKQVRPNEGFMEQLQELQAALLEERGS